MYRLKDNVDFRFVNKKSIMKYDFDLSNYYEEKTRLFKSPETYIPFSVMCEVFVDFLIPLDLVEEVKNEKDIEELANVIEENIGYNGQELFKTERINKGSK